jgi:hypothetical protein
MVYCRLIANVEILSWVAGDVSLTQERFVVMAVKQRGVSGRSNAARSNALLRSGAVKLSLAQFPG